MKYCNKDIIDVIVELEDGKYRAGFKEDYNGYIKADINLAYYRRGLEMAGMPEAKINKLRKVAQKIFKAKLEEEDINDKD